jgi:ParB-like chromosome segregation protein Spo0J
MSEAMSQEQSGFLGTGFEVHPLAMLFPLMEGDDYEQLKRHISGYGLQNPIVLWQGQIIDGRNRLRACAELALEPAFTEIEGDEMAVYQYIITNNLIRRSLTPEQRAAILVSAEAWYVIESRRQLKLIGGRIAGKGRKKQLTPNSGQAIDRHKRTTAGVLAEKAGVSRYLIEKLLGVLKDNPDLLKDIASGKTTTKEATKTQEARIWEYEREIKRINRIYHKCPVRDRRDFAKQIVDTFKKYL